MRKPAASESVSTRMPRFFPSSRISCLAALLWKMEKPSVVKIRPSTRSASFTASYFPSTRITSSTRSRLIARLRCASFRTAPSAAALRRPRPRISAQDPDPSKCQASVPAGAACSETPFLPPFLNGTGFRYRQSLCIRRLHRAAPKCRI